VVRLIHIVIRRLSSRCRHLIEWNRVLFDEVVPLAWTCALQHHISGGPLSDFFTLWPPEQPQHPQGDVAYWAKVPNFLVETSRGVSIWPLYRPSSPELVVLTDSDLEEVWSGGSHTNLATVLTVARGHSPGVLNALAAAGIALVAIPAYIQDILVSAPNPPSTLIPSTAWEVLSVSLVFTPDHNKFIHASITDKTVARQSFDRNWPRYDIGVSRIWTNLVLLPGTTYFHHPERSKHNPVSPLERNPTRSLVCRRRNIQPDRRTCHPPSGLAPFRSSTSSHGWSIIPERNEAQCKDSHQIPCRLT
jgi:hypothetical protein